MKLFTDWFLVDLVGKQNFVPRKINFYLKAGWKIGVSKKKKKSRTKNYEKCQNKIVTVKNYHTCDWNKSSWVIWVLFFFFFPLLAFFFNSNNYLELKSIFISNCHLEMKGALFWLPQLKSKKYTLKLTFSHRRFLFQQNHIFQEENCSYKNILTCFTYLPGNMKLSITSILLDFFQH